MAGASSKAGEAASDSDEDVEVVVAASSDEEGEENEESSEGEDDDGRPPIPDTKKAWASAHEHAFKDTKTPKHTKESFFDRLSGSLSSKASSHKNSARNVVICLGGAQHSTAHHPTSRKTSSPKAPTQRKGEKASPDRASNDGDLVYEDSGDAVVSFSYLQEHNYTKRKVTTLISLRSQHGF